MWNKSKARGFSLVELVIVVVIIGVIAAIAVPRISRGAKGAGDSALRGSLASLRNAIDMYAAEHNGAWPGETDGLEATLLKHLIKTTNVSGTDGIGPNFPFGPYLRRGFPPVPVGPNAARATGVIMTNAVTITTAIDETATTKGWVYNYETGEIIANTDDADEATTPYTNY